MRVRALRTALKRGAARWPNAGVAAASALGWATQGLGRGTDVDSIRYVLPDLGPAELERARRASWSSSLRCSVLHAGLSVPGTRWPFPRLVSGPDPAEIPPPAVLATFHVGPMHAVGAWLERLPAEVLVLQAGHEAKSPPRPGRTTLHVAANEWSRAAAFRTAVETLRSGAFVFLAVDGSGSRPVEAPLFGRTVGLARGAFALSRITGAPIRPVAPRWRGYGVEIVAGEPVPPADDRAMAAVLTGWLEAFVREAPGEILPALVDLLRESPLADRAIEQGRPQAVVADLAVEGARDRPWGYDSHSPGREAG